MNTIINKTIIMCGIFSLFNNKYAFKNKYINEQFMLGKGRGPEFSKLEQVHDKLLFGFHRLAINGLNNESNQPLKIDDVTLICNGEIYNYKELYDMMNITPSTDSDCEVIIHLYRKYGIEYTLQMLDGVFAFVLVDNRIDKENNTSGNVYVARDPYGIRPLYMLTLSSNMFDKLDVLPPIYGFASEIKMFSNIYQSFIKNEIGNNYKIEQFMPGTYSKLSINISSQPIWRVVKYQQTYTMPGFSSTKMLVDNDYDSIIKNIQTYFFSAIKKRVITSERPIACLLSGGLDSSLVTAIVNMYMKEITDVPLETYSIGLEGSEDHKYARIVADYLGTNHTEIVMTEEEFISVIPEVIYAIESYDTTTVRASIGNYLIGKYISEHSEAKVIFNGDGSDELCGGYLYMHKCPDSIEFDKECRRLLKDIHTFDVLRSDKCISTHGLEPRTPFLDRAWVQYYLSIHPDIRCHTKNKQCEKHLLRDSFSGKYFVDKNGKPLLPDVILWRTKEAFSDGVSKNTRSLYSIIQEYTSLDDTKEEGGEQHEDMERNEKKYYKDTFNSYYPNMEQIIPYYWMPRYCSASSSSARTLDFYNEKMNH